MKIIYFVLIFGISNFVFGQILTNVRTEDSARLGTIACSPDYSRTENCHNPFAPQAPPYIREMRSTALYNYQKSPGESATQQFYEYAGVSTNVPNKTQILPFTRTSNDGRLILTTYEPHSNAQYPFRPMLLLMRPENLNYDSKTVTKPLYSAPVHLHPLMYFNPYFTTMSTEQNRTGPDHIPYAFHYIFCDDSSSGNNKQFEISNKSNPKTCYMQITPGNIKTTPGDCYDISLQFHFEQDIDNDPASYVKGWEMRSNNYTVFIPNAKTSTSGDAGFHIFPRMTSGVLPHYSEYTIPTGKGTYELMSMCYVNAKSAVIPMPNAPKWCNFLYNQKYPTHFVYDMNGNNQEDNGERWSGKHCVNGVSDPNCKFNMLFEPSSSADGKFMIINGGDSLYYTVNTKGACDASGWNIFRPISDIPFDPRVNTKYEVGKAQVDKTTGKSIPFRDYKGRDIPQGTKIEGGYLWMDREARNLFYAAVNQSRDAYYSTSQTPNFSSTNFWTNKPDAKPGKGLTAIGSWTRGKMVLLDNSISYSDLGGYQYASEGSIEYSMKLYNNSPITKIRPRVPTGLNSFENQLNYYDAFNPIMPFDVVWTMSGDNQRNTEIIFDEYMMSSAFVVAHMNSPIENDGTGKMFYEDGFVADNPNEAVRYGGNAQFKFRKNPKLQNAATHSKNLGPPLNTPPATLEVHGGARVEPVGLGGVLGKGLFLDGNNDYIDMGFQNPESTDWVVSMWIETKWITNLDRTLFFFPDESWISINYNEIKFYNHQSALNKIKTIPLKLSMVNEKPYMHIAFKLINTIDNKRKAVAFINGTKLKTEVTWPFKTPTNKQSGGLSLYETDLNGWSWFVVGEPGPRFPHPVGTTRRSFMGWIDELRIHSLGVEESKSETYFDEFICNQALGSLILVRGSDASHSNSLIKNLSQRANNYGVFNSIVIGPTNLDQTISEIFRTSTPSRAPASLSFTSNSISEVSLQTALVCEQLYLDSHDRPFDLPDQNGKTICAGRVHKNSYPDSSLASRCYREKKFNIQLKKLEAGKPRPDFSTTPFCLSCHSNDQLARGLLMDALASDSLHRQNDPRRQPLNVPAILGGCLPGGMINYATGVTSINRCNFNNYLLDFVFDKQPKLLPQTP